jgi:hypothetical protein
LFVAIFLERSVEISEGPQLRDSNKNERRCWSSEKEGREGEVATQVAWERQVFAANKDT